MKPHTLKERENAINGVILTRLQNLRVSWCLLAINLSISPTLKLYFKRGCTAKPSIARMKRRLKEPRYNEKMGRVGMTGKNEEKALRNS
jgi:hypothetical protein